MTYYLSYHATYPTRTGQYHYFDYSRYFYRKSHDLGKAYEHCIIQSRELLKDRDGNAVWSIHEESGKAVKFGAVQCKNGDISEEIFPQYWREWFDVAGSMEDFDIEWKEI